MALPEQRSSITFSTDNGPFLRSSGVSRVAVNESAFQEVLGRFGEYSHGDRASLDVVVHPFVPPEFSEHALVIAGTTRSGFRSRTVPVGLLEPRKSRFGKTKMVYDELGFNRRLVQSLYLAVQMNNMTPDTESAREKIARELKEIESQHRRAKAAEILTVGIGAVALADGLATGDLFTDLLGGAILAGAYGMSRFSNLHRQIRTMNAHFDTPVLPLDDNPIIQELEDPEKVPRIVRVQQRILI